MPAPANYLFYSWQSDLPGAHNRSVIEHAIEAALKQINADAALESAPRDELALDKDTKGRCRLTRDHRNHCRQDQRLRGFIGDLSFVARSLPELEAAGKPTRFFPNPNVVIEYTHALDFHSDKHVIAVVN